MKILGWIYIVVGAFLAVGSFVSMVSDIQLISGFVGINIVGTGLLLKGKG